MKTAKVQRTTTINSLNINRFCLLLQKIKTPHPKCQYSILFWLNTIRNRFQTPNHLITLSQLPNYRAQKQHLEEQNSQQLENHNSVGPIVTQAVAVASNKPIAESSETTHKADQESTMLLRKALNLLSALIPTVPGRLLECLVYSAISNRTTVGHMIVLFGNTIQSVISTAEPFLDWIYWKAFENQSLFSI